MNTVHLGDYVKYKDETYLVVQDRGHLALIINPSTGKKQVAKRRLKVLKTRKDCVIVNHDYKEYVVTPTNLIFSVTSGKLMKWDTNHGTRKQIIETAESLR